ncbi:MAG: amidohydrolase family protein [Acidobacteriota bacterium]
MKPYLAHIVANLRLTGRDRTVLIFNYGFPLGFFFLFAWLGKARETNSIAGVLASVLTIGLLGNGFFGGGMRAVSERESGILRRYKVAPPGALPILVSGMVVGVLQYLPVVLLMFGVSLVHYGMEWPEQWLSFFVFVVIANLAMRSLGGIIAAVANSMAESQVIIQCFYFPMLLLSGATLPLSVLPGWGRDLVQFIPTTHLVTGLQGILLRNESLLDVWKAAAALLATTVVCTFISLKIFRWEKNERLPGRAKAWIAVVLIPFVLVGVWNLRSRENLTKARILDRAMARKESTLIRNARVFTGTGEVIESGGVLIREGRIERIYRGATPEGKDVAAIELEGAGKTLLPGLIDAHVHIGAPGGFYEDERRYQDGKLDERRLKAYLYSGITTVKSTGDWLDAALELRRRQRTGELLASEFYTVGPLFTAPGGHPQQLLAGMPESARRVGESQFLRLPRTEAEAREMVRELKARGVDGIKAVLERGWPGRPMARLDGKLLRAICAEARAVGLTVVVHTNLAGDVSEAVEAGAHGVEHGSPGETLPAELLARMAERGVFYDPTLSVFEALRMIREKDYSRLEDSLLQQAVPIELMAGTRKKLAGGGGQLVMEMDTRQAGMNLKRAYEAGVRVVTGTDAGNPLVLHGPTIQQELALWVAAGIPAERALLAATRDAALLLGERARIGTIEVGKDANLLLVDGDPVRDITSLGRISSVFLRGERVARTRLLKVEDDE